jgi:adenylate kinase family enzyme
MKMNCGSCRFISEWSDSNGKVVRSSCDLIREEKDVIEYYLFEESHMKVSRKKQACQFYKTKY